MTNSLSPQDHVRLESLWHELGECPDHFDLPGLLGRVIEMVPCDYASANEIDERHGVASSRYLPLDATAKADYHAFERHAHEHPVLRVVRLTGDGGPRRLSDVTSREQWHRLGLYQDFFRTMQVEHQAAFTAGDPAAPTAAAIALNRGAHDFDDRDMGVLTAVRPLFRLLYRLGAEQRRAAAAEIARGHPGHGVAVIGAVGHIESVDEVSARAMVAAFRVAPAAGDLAPAPVFTWLHGGAPTLEIVAEGSSVLVRRGPSLGDRRTVLFEVGRPPAGAPLTAREQQVLALVGEGCSNRAAARHLGVSQRTVEKHLEHAYLKLGVQNRTAAVHAAQGR